MARGDDNPETPPAALTGDSGGTLTPDASALPGVNDGQAVMQLPSNSATPAPERRKGYATGQTDDPVNRHPDDWYPTWPEATKALLAVEKFDGPIWEPACGEGDMSRVIEAAGHDVISTDLIDRGYGEAPCDFLMEWQSRAPNIITNPPFREAKMFVDRALQLTTGKVAMFLRLAFLEGIERGVWFPMTPLRRVWVMTRRVPMQRGKIRTTEATGMMAFAWFVWDHEYIAEPTIGFLDWKAFV